MNFEFSVLLRSICALQFAAFWMIIHRVFYWIRGIFDHENFGCGSGSAFGADGAFED